MDDNEADTHPLDRDYSQCVRIRREDVNYDPKFRRVGVICFAAGLIMMFVAAVLLTNFDRIRPVETFGSALHRLGMIVGLIGGVAILAAYRLRDSGR